MCVCVYVSVCLFAFFSAIWNPIGIHFGTKLLFGLEKVLKQYYFKKKSFFFAVIAIFQYFFDLMTFYEIYTFKRCWVPAHHPSYFLVFPNIVVLEPFQEIKTTLWQRVSNSVSKWPRKRFTNNQTDRHFHIHIHNSIDRSRVSI